MLIKKFENYSDDDDLLKYIPSDCKKISDFLNVEKQYEKQKSTITKLINEWVSINRDYLRNEIGIKFNHIDDWNITRNPNVPISLEGGFNESCYLEKNDFEDLIKYLNNPELYKYTKKYNI